MGAPSEVIHLDTSFLIRSMALATRESELLAAWIEGEEEFAVSAVVWGEFLSGPLAERQRRTVRRVVTVVPLTERDAALAADLFNRSARRRGSLPDCFIAATAIRERAALATANERDFERFDEAGLERVSYP